MKGDIKVNTDLGVVKMNKRENLVKVTAPMEMDINVAYKGATHVLSTKPEGGEQCGCGNHAGGLLSQLLDKVRRISPSFLL